MLRDPCLWRHRLQELAAGSRGDAAEAGARERLVPREETSDLFQRLMAIADSAGKVPRRENAMTDDEILGYDEFGIPTK
ncbi:protein transcription factor [Mesorhizobium sp. M7A.F.Ca.US.008.03.1.1]|uniref:protein transcription factor n=1 Tax=Mesorhizobium sp. M7A.F.Ca.US.008.03.1.1 TaxID=2496742 RepID=UPI001FE13CA8|nr:protein transcription factor [Mesorhizobium sp. M7A.F.Ca.US.008.03.1.1]